MNHQEAPFNPFPEGRFLYLPESNAMLNLEMIGLITFEGAAGDPSCVVHISGDIPPLVLRGKDIERLATALHIDFQAVQTDLQQSLTSRIQRHSS
jgi:hypothetical protein